MKVNLSEQQLKQLLAFLEYQAHEDYQFFCENVKEGYEALEREALQQGIKKPYAVTTKNFLTSAKRGELIEAFWSRDCAEGYKRVHDVEAFSLKIEIQ